MAAGRRAARRRAGSWRAIPRSGRGRRGARGWRRAVWTLAALGLLGLPVATAAVTTLAVPRAAEGCRVLSVTDGDTLRLHCPARGIERARLTGFDTPEIFSPGCPGELLRGLRATWALRVMLWRAERISLVRQGEDRYGRALVFAAVDDVPVARRMIAAGHARAYGGGRRDGWCVGAMK